MLRHQHNTHRALPRPLHTTQHGRFQAPVPHRRQKKLKGGEPMACSQMKPQQAWAGLACTGSKGGPECYCAEPTPTPIPAPCRACRACMRVADGGPEASSLACHVLAPARPLACHYLCPTTGACACEGRWTGGRKPVMHTGQVPAGMHNVHMNVPTCAAVSSSGTILHCHSAAQTTVQ